MSPPLSRLARWSPLTGLVFVALWLGGFALTLVAEPGDSDAEILAYFADDGKRGRAVTGAWLILFAVVLFVVFLGVLRSRLAGAEGQRGPFTAIGFGAGLVAAALWLVADIFFMGIAYTRDQNHDFELDPNVHRLVSEMGYLLFVVSTPVAALVVLATSLLGLRAGLVPRWLAGLGFPLAVLMTFVFLFVVPFLLFLAWVAIVSVVLAGHSSLETRPAASHNP